MRRSCSHTNRSKHQKLRAEVIDAHMQAGRPWVKQRDIPDVAGWDDLVFAPELVTEVLVRRHAKGRCPMPAYVVHLAKPGSTEERLITVMDPFDELWMRMLVGPHLPALRHALDAGYAEVFSYRLASLYPAWKTEHHANLNKAKRYRALEFLSDGSCRALGTLDIRHYYPSIRPASIAHVLQSIGAPAAHVDSLVEFLVNLRPLGAPPGLPIGPESSGLLGNLMLTGVDIALRPLVINHLRYTDDSWVFLRHARDWPEVIEVYREAVKQVELEPNEAKLNLHDVGSGEAANFIENCEIEYMIARSRGSVLAGVAAEQLAGQVALENPDYRVIRFAIAALKWHTSPLGLQIIYDHPELFTEISRDVGSYFSKLIESSKTRREVDPDFLIDVAAKEPYLTSGSRSDAASIHACGALAKLRPTRDHGRKLEEIAMSQDKRFTAPHRAFAAKGWGSSMAHCPRAAVDHAIQVGDLSLRRALLLTINRHNSNERARRKGFRRLAALEPDLEPTLAYVNGS